MQHALSSNPLRDHVSRLDEPVYSLCIELAGKLVSGNVMLRWHWRKRNAHQKQIRQDMGWLLQQEHLPPVPLLRSKVELVALLPQLMDLDNLYTGAKPYIDALTTSNVIQDDAVRYIDLTVRQRQHKFAGIIIDVTDLPVG